MGAFTVRTVSRDELPRVYPALCSLEEECFPGTSACRDNFLDLAKDPTFSATVVEISGSIIGGCYGKSDSDVFLQPNLFCRVGGDRVSASDDWFYRRRHIDGSPPNVHIKFVAVRKQFRGKSIAFRLLWKFLEEREESSVSLHVRADNPSAIEIYEIAGLSEVARKVDNGEHILMNGYTRDCWIGLNEVITELDRFMRGPDQDLAVLGEIERPLMRTAFSSRHLANVSYAARHRLFGRPRWNGPGLKR